MNVTHALDNSDVDDYLEMLEKMEASIKKKWVRSKTSGISAM